MPVTSALDWPPSTLKLDELPNWAAVDANVVLIIAVFYGGQDYEASLQGDVDHEQSIAD
jgi:hypothetical protein